MSNPKIKASSSPSVVTLRIPKELKARLEFAAEQQGVSLNQFALYILSGEVARLEASEQQAWQAMQKKYVNHHPEDELLAEARKILKRSPKTRLPDWDQVD